MSIERLANVATTQRRGVDARDVAAHDTGAAVSDLGRLGDPARGPLLAQARDAGAALSASIDKAGDAVTTGRLEKAALGFAREVRAMTVGCPDLTPGAIVDAAQAALAAGARDADALPSIGLNEADRLGAMLDHAARALAATPTPLLYVPAAAGSGV